MGSLASWTVLVMDTHPFILLSPPICLYRNVSVKLSEEVNAFDRVSQAFEGIL